MFEITSHIRRYYDNITAHCCFVLMLFTVRIESSGPTFRGFAIQARESTPSFSSTAEFVGEFVNPPPAGGDWQIWNCGAVRLDSILLLHFYHRSLRNMSFS